RVCNLGYLVELYEKDNVLGTRCPAENIENYVRKGGDINKTINKACLCNALFAKIGLGSSNEMPIITTGYDFSVVKLLVKKHGLNYTAKNVVDYILQEGN
ncbi:MAG: nitronate monooxygenase, partial [Nanoarchaeota archaeon]|nr:nitronate monooxygenase [Nanoarchaeota archaeon]